MNRDFPKKTKSPFSLIYGKVPPQAPDLEEVVIGACLLEPDTYEQVMGIIVGEDCLYVDAHQRIWAAMKRLHLKGVPVDLVTVTEELRRSSELDLIGGAYFLTRLTMDVVSSAHIEAHARIVMEKFIKREIIRVCGNMLNDAYEDSTDSLELLELASKQLEDAGSAISIGSGGAMVGEVYVDVLRDMVEQKDKGSELIGADTGYSELNQVILGWDRGDFNILAARPSQGKTALALNFCNNAVSSSITPAGFEVIYSLEAKRKPLVRRLAAAKCGVSFKAIRKATVTPAQEKMMYDHQKVFNSLPIKIHDDVYSLSSIIHSIKREYKLFRKKWIKTNPGKDPKNMPLFRVTIDYLQLIEVPKQGTREQEVALITRSLKKLAMELDINILGLSQLNRAVEKTKDKKPSIADLRESGAIEQDGQVIMMIWHERVEGGGDDGLPLVNTWIVIVKNKDGECKDVKLKFNGDLMRWVNWDESTYVGIPSFVAAGYQPVKSNHKVDEDDPF